MKLQIIFGGISEEIEVDVELSKIERHQLVLALLESAYDEVVFILNEREDTDLTTALWGV